MDVFFWNVGIYMSFGLFLFWIKSLSCFFLVRVNELGIIVFVFGIFYMFFICFVFDLVFGFVWVIILVYIWNIIGLIILVKWNVLEVVFWFVFLIIYVFYLMFSVFYGWVNI